ncbi:bacterial transcriptional activator domain-containing protein [Acrocarpospora sp. B8E8]|uniref:bacterial transcriptional activator domain-containing protein n=1 Tax=Acrocarpospora sp. B8E8 TaxID=3153572 RepID=UPI00325E888E
MTTRRTGEVLRGLTALLVLIVLIAGLPLLLQALAGPPWPGHLPSWEELTGRLLRRDNGTLLIAALRLIGWATWAAFTLSTLLEALARRRGNRAAALPGLGTLQRMTAQLIASVTLITHSSLTPMAAAAPPAVILAAISTSNQSSLDRPSAEPRPDTHTPPETHTAADITMPIAFGTGLLAGGILTTLARLRHHQRQQRAPGRRIHLPESPHIQRVEQDLHRHDRFATQTDRQLATTLTVLSDLLHRQDPPIQGVAGIHLAGDRVEVILTAPAPQPPPPFTVMTGSQDMRWRLNPAQDPADSPIRPGPLSHPVPGVVTAGFTQDGGRLLLDLQRLGVTLCRGATALIDAYLRMIAVEAATSPWAPWRQIILIGFPEMSVLGHRAVNYAALGPALDMLHDRAGRTRPQHHTDAGRGSMLAKSPDLPSDEPGLRADHDESNALILLISVTPPAAQDLDRLRTLVQNSTGIAAILPDNLVRGADDRPGGRFELANTQHGPILHASPMGLTVRPPALPAPAYRDLALLFGATQPADLDRHTPPYPTPGPPTAAAAESDHGLQIRILGPLEILGAHLELLPKQAELVLLLALHEPYGLRNSQLATYLGPDEDTPKPPDSLRQHLSRTRQRLGTAPDGQQRIRHIGNGLYRLHDATLDWARFQHLATLGRTHPTDGIPHLRDALTLIRGQAFTGCYHWWLQPSLLETIRAEIVDTAAVLADLELCTGNPAAAARAARCGLTADPSAEQLWRALMRAEHAAGNLATLHQTWKQCLRQISDISLDGRPHPDTIHLFHQLTTGPRAGAMSP